MEDIETEDLFSEEKTEVITSEVTDTEESFVEEKTDEIVFEVSSNVIVAEEKIDEETRQKTKSETEETFALMKLVDIIAEEPVMIIDEKREEIVAEEIKFDEVFGEEIQDVIAEESDSEGLLEAKVEWTIGEEKMEDKIIDEKAEESKVEEIFEEENVYLVTGDE